MNEREALRRLGLEPGASETDIKLAYKRLAQNAHSDHGGSDREMSELSHARDDALEAVRQRHLPATLDVRELVELQSRALERVDQRREHALRTDSLKRTLIGTHTSELNTRKRQVQLAAWVGAAFTGLSALLRQLSVAPFYDDKQQFITDEILLSVLGLLTVLAGLAFLLLRVRVQQMEHLVEDAADALNNRATCLALLDEIEDVGGIREPWTSTEVTKAVQRWSRSAAAESGSIGALASRIGPKDFQSLLLATAVDQGLLREEYVRTDDGHGVIYTRQLPNPVA